MRPLVRRVNPAALKAAAIAGRVLSVGSERV